MTHGTQKPSHHDYKQGSCFSTHFLRLRGRYWTYLTSPLQRYNRHNCLLFCLACRSKRTALSYRPINNTMNHPPRKPTRRASKRPTAAGGKDSLSHFMDDERPKTMAELSSSWGDLSLMMELDEHDASKREPATSKEMLKMFGFSQSHCDFCWKEVDLSQAQLQQCMCKKKYFCRGCSQSPKVSQHQQDCALERFERKQGAAASGLSSRTTTTKPPVSARTTTTKKAADCLSQSDHAASHQPPFAIGPRASHQPPQVGQQEP